MKQDIVRRYRGNPILTNAAIRYPVETVHNAAVAKREDEYVMLFRSHLRTGRSILGLARSSDGFQFTADPEPFLTPAQDGPFAAYEEFGVEDPGITRIEAEYLITYSAYSRNGVRVALAKTMGFKNVERVRTYVDNGSQSPKDSRQRCKPWPGGYRGPPGNSWGLRGWRAAPRRLQSDGSTRSAFSY